jgi:hypothetical protein
MLAPWPATEHYTEAERRHGDHLPANAGVEPLSSSAPTNRVGGTQATNIPQR